jgi:hypothetical protein
MLIGQLALNATKRNGLTRARTRARARQGIAECSHDGIKAVSPTRRCHDLTICNLLMIVRSVWLH